MLSSYKCYQVTLLDHDWSKQGISDHDCEAISRPLAWELSNCVSHFFHYSGFATHHTPASCKRCQSLLWYLLFWKSRDNNGSWDKELWPFWRRRSDLPEQLDQLERTPSSDYIVYASDCTQSCSIWGWRHSSQHRGQCWQQKRSRPASQHQKHRPAHGCKVAGINWHQLMASHRSRNPDTFSGLVGSSSYWDCTSVSCYCTQSCSSWGFQYSVRRRRQCCQSGGDFSSHHQKCLPQHRCRGRDRIQLTLIDREITRM